MASLSQDQDKTSVKVYALHTGSLYLPDRWLFDDGDEDLQNARQYVPDYSFLIEHPTGQRALFDLGLRKDLNGYPPLVQKDYHLTSPDVPLDIVDLLTTYNLHPSDINTIIFSHLHFDHIGDVTKFPTTNLLAGPGSRAASSPGYPHDPKSGYLAEVIEHPHFSELTFPASNLPSTLSTSTTSLAETLFGPAHDLFSDGSVLLLSTPGHMPGHLGLLARTAPHEYIFAGGDCCHHRSLLLGTRAMGVSGGPNGAKSFHGDPDTAEETIGKVRRLEAESDGEVLVALPHDDVLVGLMPVWPEGLTGWRGSEWIGKVAKRVERVRDGVKS